MIKKWLILFLFLPTFAQAGWTYIDMKPFWIPGPGEPQSPPIVPISGSNQGPANPPPALNLPSLPPGWQYDPKWCPPPPSAAPSYSLTEAQALGIANAANGIAAMIGQHTPSQALIEYQQVNTQIEKDRLERSQLEEKTRRMMEEAKKSSSLATPSASEESIGKSFEELAASQKTRLSINPDTIPDPEESQLPYELRSAEGPFRDELLRTYKNLHKIEPKGRIQQRAKEIGILGVREADQSFIEGDQEQSTFWKALAEEALEIAIGLNPTTGLIQSMYELVIGKSIVTSDDLSTTQRAFAFLGVVTLGGARSLTVAGSVMNKIYRGAGTLLKERVALEVAVREGELLVEKGGRLLEGWQKSHKILNIHTAEHVNTKYFSHWTETPPFQLGSHVVEFKTLKETNWVRVHAGTNQARPWIMRKSAIQGLTPQQIADKFALGDRIPTHISDVQIPTGTSILRGNIQEHGAGISGNVQYWINESLVTADEMSSWFKNMRNL